MATIINKKTNVPGQAQEQAQKTPMLGGGGQAASAPASAGTQGPQQKSGGFTNLSSYLSANRDAGSKIAGEIGKGVQKDIGQKKDIAAKETGEFKSSIESAQKNIQQGEQFLQQLTPTQQAQAAQQPQQAAQPTQPELAKRTSGKVEQGGKYVPPETPATAPKMTPNLQDVSSITNDPNLMNQFTGMRTGETFAADKASMYGDTGNAGEYGQAFGATQDLAKTYGSRIGQVQGEGAGRFGLLKEFLATPKQQYGKGLSSLDNALLQTDKTKSLQNLSQNLQKQSVADVAAQTKALEEQNLQAKAAVAKGQELGGGGKEPGKIQARTGEIINEADKALKDPEYVKQLNAERAAKQEWAKNQMERMKSGEAIDAEFAQMMGIEHGQRIGNIADKDVSQYLKFNAAELGSGLQALTPEQQASLSSMYKLAGQEFTTPQQAAAAIEAANKFKFDQQLSNAAISAQNRTSGGGATATTTQQEIAQKMQQLGFSDSQAMDFMNSYASGQYNPNLDDFVKGMVGGIKSEGWALAGGSHADQDYQLNYNANEAKRRAIYNALNDLKSSGYFNTAKIQGLNTKGTPKV